MGDPKKSTRKYKTPTHPWNKARLDEEEVLVKEFGLKNKRELWKMSAKLRHYKQRAKRYIADTSEQVIQERKAMIAKLIKQGILQEGGQLDDVLGLSLQEIMERRLQTIVFKKKLAGSISQSRQFITHRHIEVAGVRMTSPSYLVSTEEEQTVGFTEGTSFKSEDHPERIAIIQQAKNPKPVKEETDKPHRGRPVRPIRKKR